jgi:CheY-like chemotaxis protein
MEKKFNFLLIDDDDIFNYLSKRILLKSDVANSIIDFTNAKSALDFIKSTDSEIDIILLDINMPIMNGFDFLDSFIQLANKQISVYMLTSSIDDADMIKSLKYPCVKGYFSKPLTIDTIAQIYSIQEMHTIYEK